MINSHLLQKPPNGHTAWTKGTQTHTTLNPPTMNSNLKRPMDKSDSPQCRNAARMSTLSGRHIPMKYTTPLDTKHLMGKDEFERKYIRNKPGNRYTDDEAVVEVPDSVHHRSPVSPTTPTTATSTSATQRSDTVTSVGSNTTYQESQEDHAPTGWYCRNRESRSDYISLGFGLSGRKRSKDNSSDDSVKPSPKKLHRSSSWKSWCVKQLRDN